MLWALCAQRTPLKAVDSNLTSGCNELNMLKQKLSGYDLRQTKLQDIAIDSVQKFSKILFYVEKDIYSVNVSLIEMLLTLKGTT